MRGTRPLKRPELLQGHRRHRALVPVDAPPAEPPPDAPSGLLPTTNETWNRLWTSFLACAWNRQTDMPAIARYALNLDKWFRYEEMVAKVPVVKGSMGQLRANPLAGRMDALEGQLRFTEEQYGLTPASRIRLGLEIIEHRRSLAEELLARLDEDVGEQDVIDVDDL